MPHIPDESSIPASLDGYCEALSKCVFQTGMSWKMIEKKWPEIRAAFGGFQAEDIAGYDERDIENLMNDPRVVRNYRKLNAIVTNTRQMRALAETHGSFAAYLDTLGDFEGTLAGLKRDFKFMGPAGVYMFLYTVGRPVPDHDEFEEKYKK